ncbi:uncharacterized protein J4E79_000761 [Alternaria viburni]|uniref:uncharacterized protein n=1 Tax=Alternaria viburni TaxID=566460 RepID=UPI0020C577E6|nr:uncharacterized protein J4E79_000761 [Alternaria viburni]KAI4670479.1 hypothetical protein J4E79_000761 [Alternaria viburni]
MAGKVTYSRRPNKRRAPHDRDPADENDDRHKRNKTNTEPNGSRLPTPPSSRRGKKSWFNGPVSIPDDDMNPPRSIFDKVLENKKHQAPKPHQRSVQGDRENFKGLMKTGQKSREQNGWARNGSLPTPPAEAQKKAHQQARRDENFARYKGTIHRNEPAILKSSPTAPNQTSRLFERVIKNEQPKAPYKPKAYKAEEIAAPRRTIMGERLSRSSDQARKFKTNQTDSPLLQLPENVRNLIYTYTLGGKTINIGYQTYHLTFDPTKPKKVKRVTPIFKYQCTVYDGTQNPFKTISQPWVKRPTVFTLLNGVCRQMYQETATLPYRLNLIAFDSYSIMFNFLFLESRLHREHLDAFTELLLPNQLPGSNALARLSNVSKVYLGVTQEGKPKGWYRVVRTQREEPRLARVMK